jgi:hypothetical protein
MDSDFFAQVLRLCKNILAENKAHETVEVLVV